MDHGHDTGCGFFFLWSTIQTILTEMGDVTYDSLSHGQLTFVVSKLLNSDGWQFFFKEFTIRSCIFSKRNDTRSVAWLREMLDANFCKFHVLLMLRTFSGREDWKSGRRRRDGVSDTLLIIETALESKLGASKNPSGLHTSTFVIYKKCSRYWLW